MSTVGELKRAVCAEVDRRAGMLVGALEQAGLTVQRSAYGLGTAFAARHGRRG